MGAFSSASVTAQGAGILRQDIGVFEGKIIEAAQVLILITVVVVSCSALLQLVGAGEVW